MSIFWVHADKLFIDLIVSSLPFETLQLHIRWIYLNNISVVPASVKLSTLARCNTKQVHTFLKYVIALHAAIINVNNKYFIYFLHVRPISSLERA